MKAHEAVIGSLTIVGAVASAPFVAATHVSKKAKEARSRADHGLRNHIAKASASRNKYLPR